MKYRNVKTGNVIDVSGHICGKDWQAVTPAEKSVNKEIAPAQKKQTTKKPKE